MKRRYAIIVAGGSGSRMKSDIPKQFLLLSGTPIIMHTLSKFADCDNIILVLPENQMTYWKELCTDHSFNLPHKVIAGGHTRFQSVKNGLRSIPDTGLVAIHDGVRPLISKEAISTSFELAEKYGSAIASIPLKDSIRVYSDTGYKAADRSQYMLIQTPQTFHNSLIKKAYQADELPIFTDDATVLESSGYGDIQLFSGSPANIKITTPEDLKIAEAMF